MKAHYFEVSNILWTTDGTAGTTNSPMELLSMLPESSFQSEYNITKHSIVLQDTKILQVAKDGLSSLLEGDYNCIISKSPKDVGKKPNLFQRDIPTMGLSTACKSYPIPLKYQKFINEEIRLPGKLHDCISKSLRPWATPVIVVPKKPYP